MLSTAQRQALDQILSSVQLIRELDIPAGPPVTPVTGDLPTAVRDCPEGAILDLQARTIGLPASLVLDRPVTLRNGTVVAAAGLNDLVDIRGDAVSLVDLTLQGNGATKRGIAANGRDMILDRVRVENIRRAGQESQAIAMWNGTGLIVRDSYLEGGSIGFLSGGTGTTVPNHVPSDLLFERVTFTRPLAWRGQGYGCKTGFELKNARRVTVRDCVIEHVWQEAQSGYALTLTPSDPAGGSPETTVEDVLIERSTIRDVGSGVNLLGSTQHPERPTRRAHTLRFVDNTWILSRALFGGHGALTLIGRGPDAVTWERNTVTTDGDAFLRTSDSVPVTAFRFTGNTVRVAGAYGIFTPLGSRGAGLATIFPGADISGNTLVNAHVLLRSSLPNNTYVTEP